VETPLGGTVSITKIKYSIEIVCSF
jgi:hypothetical protein